SSCTSRFYCDGVHRDLHSFPTRRSSDLLRVSSFPFTPIIAYVVKFCSRISILSPGRMPSEVKFLVPELTTSDPWDVERSLPTIAFFMIVPANCSGTTVLNLFVDTMLGTFPKRARFGVSKPSTYKCISS